MRGENFSLLKAVVRWGATCTVVLVASLVAEVAAVAARYDAAAALGLAVVGGVAVSFAVSRAVVAEGGGRGLC